MSAVTRLEVRIETHFFLRYANIPPGISGDVAGEGEQDPPFPKAVTEVASGGEDFSEFNVWAPIPFNDKTKQ